MWSQVALESTTMNKVSGGDGIPVELFKSWKMMLWKCSTQYASKFGKLCSGHRKRSIFIPIPKKGNAKECSDYRTIALISHASKVMPQILPARLQQYMNHEIPDIQAGFSKNRGTRDQIANIHWTIRKVKEYQKNIYFCFIDYAKPLTVSVSQFSCSVVSNSLWPHESQHARPPCPSPSPGVH